MTPSRLVAPVLVVGLVALAAFGVVAGSGVVFLAVLGVGCLLVSRAADRYRRS